MEAVIFDFDGTIVDTEQLWVDNYLEIIQQKYNHTVPMDIFKLCVGTTDHVLYDYLVENVNPSIRREDLSPIVEQRIGESMNALAPREGVVELMDFFKDAGLRLAISSGSQKKWILQYLEAQNLGHYFEEIRCADDVKNVKPHPELYLAALEALRLPASACIAIEDSVNGSKSAVAAGITCYVVPSAITAKLIFPKQVLLRETFDNISAEFRKSSK